MVHLYETYCLDESVDKISFDPFIVEEIRNSKALAETLGISSVRAGSDQLQPPVFFSLSVATGPYSGVVKLQTMRCLFEAYEHVLSLLERVFTPMFCHSDEVRADMFTPDPTALCSHGLHEKFTVSAHVAAGRKQEVTAAHLETELTNVSRSKNNWSSLRHSVFMLGKHKLK